MFGKTKIKKRSLKAASRNIVSSNDMEQYW